MPGCCRCSCLPSSRAILMFCMFVLWRYLFWVHDVRSVALRAHTPHGLGWKRGGQPPSTLGNMMFPILEKTKTIPSRSAKDICTYATKWYLQSPCRPVSKPGQARLHLLLVLLLSKPKTWPRLANLILDKSGIIQDYSSRSAGFLILISPPPTQDINFRNIAYL